MIELTIRDVGNEQIAALEQAVILLTQRGEGMALAIDDLTAKVTAMEATVGAVVTQLGELTTALANATDLSQVQALADRLGVLTTQLADAATAADITPETPVPGATGTVVIPPEGTGGPA